MAMQIWLVCRDDQPRAVFSTAGAATDYVADNGGAGRCGVQRLVLDANTRSQRFFSKWLASPAPAGAARQ